MLVGVPKEIKDNEFRVSVIPATVDPDQEGAAAAISAPLPVLVPPPPPASYPIF